METINQFLPSNISNTLKIVKNIVEAILSKSKITTSQLKEEILKDLLDSWYWENGKEPPKNMIELDGSDLIIKADHIGKEHRYARERVGLESIKLGEFCEKYGVKNIIIENNTGYSLDIRPYSPIHFKGINIINKGKVNVTIRHVKKFEGGSLKGDVRLEKYEDKSIDPFKFIDIPMYYPIYTGIIKMDGTTLIQVLRKLEETIPSGHIFDFILLKGNKYTQRLYVSKGISPEDIKKNYKTSEYKGNGVYYGFMEVKTRGQLVYSVTKY